MKLTSDISSEELEKIALNIINIIDYDIMKECRWNIEENGEDDLAMELMDYLLSLVD